MKRRFKYLALMLGVGLLVCEVLMRLLVGVPPQHPFPQVPLTHHPVLGFLPPKNFEGYSLEAKVTLNTWGFRAPLPEEMDTSKKTIVALGDSFLFGQGVDKSHTFSSRLSQKINYINLGVPAFDTLQELNTLKEYGMLYRPDAVHLHFFINDLLPNRSPEMFEHLNGTPRHDKNSVWRHSALLVGLGRGWRQARDRHHPVRRALRLSDPPQLESWDSLWQKNFNILLDFKKFCDDKNLPLTVIVHPIPGQTRSMPERYQSVLLPWLTQHNISHIDLRAHLSDGCWIPLDGHYSVEGHRRVARRLSPQ